MSLASRFPGHWLVEVTVDRSGGTDPKGNLLPGSSHTVPECLVSTQTSAEDPQSRSDLPESTAWIHTAPGANFQSMDRVTVPEGSLWPHGRFVVNGDPDFWPLGTRVGLRRI